MSRIKNVDCITCACPVGPKGFARHSLSLSEFEKKKGLDRETYAIIPIFLVWKSIFSLIFRAQNILPTPHPLRNFWTTPLYCLNSALCNPQTLIVHNLPLPSKAPEISATFQFWEVEPRSSNPSKMCSRSSTLMWVLELH